MTEESSSLSREDREHLKLLTVFYVVHAVLLGLVSLLPLVYVLVGGIVLAGSTHGRGTAPPAGIGIGLIVLGLTFSGLIFLKGAANAYSAYCLSARRHRVFCLVTAGFNCLSAPLGTALGVFTFVVLQRPTVVSAFDAPT